MNSRTSLNKLACRFCRANLLHHRSHVECRSDQCAMLDVLLCVPCLSENKQDALHRRDHPTATVRNTARIDGRPWFAYEEFELKECRNNRMSWKAVGRKLGKEPAECRRYFEQYFLDSHDSDTSDSSLELFNYRLPYSSYCVSCSSSED